MPSTRRSFLVGLGAFGSMLTLPGRLRAAVAPVASPLAGSVPLGSAAAEPAIPPTGQLSPAFWRELRGQFLIPPEEAFFNTGTCGASPRRVLDAVIAHMTHVERDLAHWDYKQDHENYYSGTEPEEGLRAKLARLLNAEVDEVALTPNSTSGMNFMANGLSLGAGDEIIVMENAHPGGRCGWELRAKRYGAQIKFVKPALPPQTPDELIALYEQATTPQTRVWQIPHISSHAAIRFPVEEMCRRARARGILSVVDGAQTLGHLVIDVKAMNCDAYFSSPHKFLCAPKGTGVLYVRREVHPRVWTTLASTGWDSTQDGIRRLMYYGATNLSVLKGVEQAADFHIELQPARIEERIIGLAERLRSGLQRIPGVKVMSSPHPALRSATTVYRLENMPAPKVQDALWDRAKIRVRSQEEINVVRQCCHIYNLEAEIDRTLETVQQLARS